MSENQTSAGQRARALIRETDRASLATVRTEDGWPFASLVMVACGQDAAPLLLLSDLAEHTRNLARADRAALLFDGTGGLDNPLAGARVTVMGAVRRCDDPGLLARYVARHPDAEAFAGFADFHLYRMEIQRAHLVAGFGDIAWIEGAAVRLDPAPDESLIAAESRIVAHMNDDHADALDLYATALLDRVGEGWTMTGLDPEGLDLRRGGEVGRVEFARLVHGPESARAELVRLVGEARAAAG